MPMNKHYPFDMRFEGLSDKALLKYATQDLVHFDRADLLNLIGELAVRYADALDAEDTP